MRVAVTGSTGKLGRAVLEHLRERGHEAIGLDAVGPREPGFTHVDLRDYGAVVDAFSSIDNRHTGLDAVVHLAAYPAGGIAPDSTTFHTNMAITFNVFQAARRVGIDRIVYASSETLLGLPFETPPPYAPLDELFESRPESMYAVVKHLEEELAQKLVRWDPALSITALRFSNVMSPKDYEEFESWQHDAAVRRWNLWGYIDARDGAQAVELALQKGAPGFEAFIIAAADTVMQRASAELMAEHFADVAITTPLVGRETLLAIGKARRVLGYEPQYSWLDHQG